MRFKYKNELDTGTVFMYSDQVATLPATNVQRGILSKVYKSDSDFIVHSSNVNLPFRNTSTGSVKNAQVASGTYTGSGMALQVQTALNATGDYADHTVSYDSATEKFTISRPGGSGLLSLLFDDPTYKFRVIANLAGYARETDYTGSFGYSGTATLGNEHQIIIELTATASVTSFILDNHNLTSGSVVRMRLAQAATDFNGGYNLTSSIIHTSTMSYNSGLMSVSFAVLNAKALQLWWQDKSVAFTTIGRLWAGPHGDLEHKTNTLEEMHYNEKNRINRSKQFVAESGATWFDRKDSLLEFRIPIDFLDPYYNSATVSLLNDLLDRVSTHQSFYLSFEESGDPIGMTYYGFFYGKKFIEKRLKKSPVFKLRDLVFREQK